MNNRITDENIRTLFDIDETSDYPLREWIFNCPLDYSSINMTKGCITLKISLPNTEEEE